MAARTAEVRWALRCAHQGLSARCQGLHFMINILKGAFSSTDPSPGVSGCGELEAGGNTARAGGSEGPHVWPGIPRLLPTPQHNPLPGNGPGEETSTNEESPGAKCVSVTVRLWCP